MSKLVVIAHNIRSTHNIGAIFRSAECFGVEQIIISGYTPYPKINNDQRLPHLADKIHNQIHKTALGTEASVPFIYSEYPPIEELKKAGYTIAALEQAASSIPLRTYQTPEKLALVLGEEVSGVPRDILSRCDVVLEIPLLGKKESLNVSVATGIALYQLCQK